MPFGSEGTEPGIGLALSGGGFRATLFHCGVLWRLNELGHLQKLSRVSSVSGGSIVAGVLGLKWAKLRQANWSGQALIDGVITPLRKFCEQTIDAPSILEGVLMPGETVADVLTKAYRKHLFGTATLADLPDDPPRFVFNSTNLATGVDFRFSKPYCGDYRIGLIRRPRFEIALAVAASSAFPPFLSPVTFEPDPASFEHTPGADLYHEPKYRERLLLTDGGAYDNLGLETVWRRLTTLLVSDAGAPFHYEAAQGRDWFRQALRALDIATNQARGMRKRVLVDLYTSQQRTGAYWGIATPISSYRAASTLPVPPERTDELARIRTRLNPFTQAEQESLINWGYAVSDAAIRTFFDRQAAPPAAWPYPARALDKPLGPDVKVEDTRDLVEPPEAP
jgi:NTE family protein